MNDKIIFIFFFLLKVDLDVQYVLSFVFITHNTKYNYRKTNPTKKKKNKYIDFNMFCVIFIAMG